MSSWCVPNSTQAIITFHWLHNNSSLLVFSISGFPLKNDLLAQNTVLYKDVFWLNKFGERDERRITLYSESLAPVQFWRRRGRDYVMQFLEDTMREPSRLKWTAETGSEWAGRFFNCFPVLTSQIRTDSSKLPDTIKLDWGLNPQHKT